MPSRRRRRRRVGGSTNDVVSVTSSRECLQGHPPDVTRFYVFFSAVVRRPDAVLLTVYAAADCRSRFPSFCQSLRTTH